MLNPMDMQSDIQSVDDNLNMIEVFGSILELYYLHIQHKLEAGITPFQQQNISIVILIFDHYDTMQLA